MIALVALDASAAGRRLWLGAVMEEVAEVAKTAKAAQARKTLSAQMVVASGARSNLQAASARLAARSGRTTKGRPRGGRAGRGPSASAAFRPLCCEDSNQKASKAHTLRNPSTGAAIAWTEVDRHSLLYRLPLRGPRRRDSRSDRDPNAQAGVNALTETTSIHTQGVITRLAVACESRGSGSLPLSE